MRELSISSGRRDPPRERCPHHILMELRTAKEMLAEYLDARPSEVDAMIRERIAERVSVLMARGRIS